MGLFLYLSSGAAVDPSEAQAWFVSPDGRQFLTEARCALGQASAASGTDPVLARAAAERTTAAAYTTGPG